MSRGWRSIGVLLSAVVLLVGSAAQASASTSTFTYVLLTSGVNVAPSNSDSYPVVLATDVVLRAGETRRISDRLGVTLSSSEGAEVDNRLSCLDPSSGLRLGQASGGTDHPGSGAGEVGLTESTLVTAPYAGTFECEIQAQTSDGARTDYHMTAVSAGGAPSDTTGTWMQISATDEVGAHQWVPPYCNSKGDDGFCPYLGGSDDPLVWQSFKDHLPAELPPSLPPPGPDIWLADTDTTTVDAVGSFQVTSCPSGTSSCLSNQRGSGATYAEVQSFLEFDQLYPNGSVCRVHQSYDPVTGGVYYVYNYVHHLPISYHVTAPVSPNCGGSRRFAPIVYFRWLGGNPIKIDGGNINVVNSVRAAAATTVPDVGGATEAQADATIKAAGLTPLTVDRVMNPATAGTVFDENAPGGTVEPTGSQVQIRISLGRSTVPNVLSEDRASAQLAIAAAGLAVGAVSTVTNCIDNGTVQMQNPAGGAAVLPGTAVSITVSTCHSTGGGGNPILPK